MAELVDAHVSGACSERSAGSSPVPGTKIEDLTVFFFYARNSPFELLVDGIRRRLQLKSCLLHWGRRPSAPGTKENLSSDEFFFFALLSPWC